MYKSLSQCTCGRAARSSSAAATSAAPNSRRHFASTSSATQTTPRRIVASIWPAQPFGTRWTRSRTFTSSTQVRAAVVDGDHPLPFPQKANPSPFEIFHLPRDKKLSPKEVKGRYLELVKLYHPDRRAARADRSGSSTKGRGKSAAADDDHEFKAIVAAYELLSDPKRRETYLRTGFGWGGSGRSGGGFGGGGGGGGGPASPWSQSTAEYHFRRGRPMSSRTGRYSGTYDHWAWHAASGHYSGWSDPFNPHFRADEAPRSGGGGGGMAAGSSSASAGWDGQGLFGRNGAVFLALMSITLFLTPLSAWYAVPTAPPGLDPFAPGSDGKLVSELEAEKGGGGSAWIPRVYDKRHQDAAANLHKARMEARVMGQEKRDALKRRVQQIRREQAFERAQEMEAIERGQAGTGHQLALPAPPSS